MSKELVSRDTEDAGSSLEMAVLSLANRYNPRLVRGLARVIRDYVAEVLKEFPQMEAVIVTSRPDSPKPNILVYSVVSGMPQTMEGLHLDSTPLKITERQRAFRTKVLRHFGPKAQVGTEWIGASSAGPLDRYNQAELVRRFSQGEMEFLGATYRLQDGQGQVLIDTQTPKGNLPNRGIRDFLGAIRHLLPSPRS